MESEYKKLIYKKLFFGVILHALILWAALALGYNSYKEFMREIEPLSREVKDSIKAIFPWAILLFSSLYFIFIRLRKTFETNRTNETNETNKTFNPQPIFLNISQYVFMLTLYGVLINVFFFSKGRDILIPLNLSVLYSVILLTILLGLSRLFYFENLASNLQPLTSRIQDWLPPIIYRFLMNNLPKVQSYVKEKPSAPFIIAFMALLIICALLLIFKVEKAAEQLANIAYFSLVVGVGIELYQMIKYGKHNTGNDE
ncbi:MAG: hypothetical protein HY752_07470 [Nitrospirae bacterium]|nr:hypothetical protein [Nitrospirota bacterium]